MKTKISLEEFEQIIDQCFEDNTMQKFTQETQPNTAIPTDHNEVVKKVKEDIDDFFNMIQEINS